MKKGALITSLSQLWKFANVLKTGDSVVTYDSAAREYYVGEISGPYEYRENAEHEFYNIRPVTWSPVAVSRDRLSLQARNSLGSTLTVFRVSGDAEREIKALLAGKEPPKPRTDKTADNAGESAPDLNAESMYDKARELIKDKIMALSWDDVEELTAGILRAMGYKTRRSPAGADRGKDIVASPDGLGFEQPRIVAEVKHRAGKMGAQEIRSFIGGRHEHDKGLYVSTGGFTKDAKYEADRAAIPLTLADIDDLVDIFLENYPALDAECKAPVPLKSIFWPVL